jgi:phospholipid/cholesterol/gamma-HCH transport system ATP-binding protein
MTEELARSLGLTVFLVTHDLDTLHAICDRVAVLYGGKVAALGTIPEVVAGAKGWVKEYFSGPRGRAAGRGAAGG